MKYKAAKALVFYTEGDTGLIGYNYLQNKRFACQADIITLLQSIGDWHSVEAITTLLDADDEALLAQQLAGLSAAGVLLAEGSDEASREQAHFDVWKWGSPAALYHHAVQDRPVMPVDESLALQRKKIGSVDQPDPYFVPDNDVEKVELPRDWGFGQTPLSTAMEGRRTLRDPIKKRVPLAALADCLRAGFGINGYTDNEAGVRLPFSYTPSGGARNPYDAFVFARDVDGLAPGLYQYAPLAQSLVRKGACETSFSEILGGQDWPDLMPCLIILRADFTRSMWKYHDANAYRVALIEAGHIGQNIMLSASAHGMSACPSAAINHSLVAQKLDHSDEPAKAAIYALTLGYPEPDAGAKSEGDDVFMVT